MTDYLIGVDQNIPDWLVKIMFWGESETAIRSGIKSNNMHSPVEGQLNHFQFLAMMLKASMKFHVQLHEHMF